MEKEAFERELLALTDTLYRVSASILPRQCDREDTIQESILTALQKRERLRDDGALRAWVVRILVNNCYDILRSQKRETSLPPDQAEIMRWDASPDADLMMRDLLLGLADEYRLPLMLFYAEGYRIREIAEILHLPQGTVQSRLHRAKKLLRQSMALEREMKPSRLRCAFGSTPASVRRTVEKAARNPASQPAHQHGYPAEANDPPAPPSRARFFALLIPAALLLALTALLAFSSGRLPL